MPIASSELACPNQLKKIAANPGRYFRLLRKALLQGLSPLLVNSAFRLQGQMDIHANSRWYDRSFVEQFGGFQLPDDSPRMIGNLDAWDSVRRDMMVLLMRDLLDRQVAGDIAELGVYKGYTARLIHHYMPEKILHLYDTFQGFDVRDVKEEIKVKGRKPRKNHFSDTSVEGVLRLINSKNGRVRVHQGFFPESALKSQEKNRYCLVHLDADLYAPIMAGLHYFYPRVVSGGFILVHDFNAWPGARTAVSEFFQDKPENPIPMPDKNGSALVQKM